jgi:hypothetical protein
MVPVDPTTRGRDTTPQRLAPPTARNLTRDPDGHPTTHNPCTHPRTIRGGVRSTFPDLWTLETIRSPTLFTDAYVRERWCPGWYTISVPCTSEADAASPHGPCTPPEDWSTVPSRPAARYPLTPPAVQRARRRQERAERATDGRVRGVSGMCIYSLCRGREREGWVGYRERQAEEENDAERLRVDVRVPPVQCDPP